MPKRKHSDVNYIKYKIKKLERKLLKSRKTCDHDHESSAPTGARAGDSSPECSIIREPDISESVSANMPVEKEVDVTTDQQVFTHLCDDAIAATASDNTADMEVNEAPVVATADTIDIEVNEAPVTIDTDILEILGEDPTVKKSYGKSIQADLAVRLNHYSTEGLTKELRKEVTAKYLTPNNCTLIDPPALNAEIKAAVTDNIIKRDKAIESKQKKLAYAISALSEAITLYISNPHKDPVMLKLLMDTVRILCDCQHNDSITRKNFILFALKKEIKNQLSTTKIDNYLFGENLPEILKSAKAINKSVSDLKPAPVPTPKPAQYKKPTSKNWKAPPLARRQPEAPRTTREPAFAPPTKNRPTTSSRPSYQRGHLNRR